MMRRQRLCARMAGATAGLFLLVATAVLGLAQAASDVDPRDTMRRVLVDSQAEDEVASVRMELIDANGRVRRRSTTISSKKRKGGGSARLIRFHEPPDLARAAILTIDAEGRDPDQWIYLPAYHAARRVAAANRGDTWMGTDLTYEDITEKNVDQYAYTTLGHEQIDDVRCTVIAAVPTHRTLREQSAYSKTIYWVDPNESVALKIEYYDRAGRLLKIVTNTDLRRHGKYRRWDVTRVRDVVRNHQTVLTVTERKIDRGLSDDLFGVPHLERGR